VAGRPYGLWVHGNNDTVGAANAVDKVATGLALNKAADVLEVIGTIDAGVRERAYELGGTLAATLTEERRLWVSQISPWAQHRSPGARCSAWPREISRPPMFEA